MILSLLAALIFYGGAGVNLVTYCCDDCFKAGIQAVMSESCCSSCPDGLEKKQKEVDLSIQIASVKAIHDCGIERLEFKWTTNENQHSLFMPSMFSDVLFTTSSISLVPELVLCSSFLYNEDHPPAFLHPRYYLSLLRMLLI